METRDIVKVWIFDTKIQIEHIGECEVNGGQVRLKDRWETFSNGYVPNTRENICEYLMSQKRYYREEINYFNRLIDLVDLEIMKQMR